MPPPTDEPDRRLRVAFMGTPTFAVSTLRALAADPRLEVVLVVSQPDKPAGRGKRLRSPPVVECARELGVDCVQPTSLRQGADVEALISKPVDLAVVVAYGKILPERLLAWPRLGCVNVHASLLPRWRGAAPIQRAVQAGDAVTGVTIMRMERGLDTGPVYGMAATMIGDTETASELHDRLSELGAALLVETLDRVLDPSFVPTRQPSTRSTYAPMLTRADREVRFSEPATLVAAHINGVSGSPGVVARCGDETLLLVRATVSSHSGDGAPPGAVIAADPHGGLHIACGSGAVEILEVQRPGKRVMATAECLRGVSLPIGARVESGL